MWAAGSFFSLPSFDLELFCARSSEIQATDMHLVPPVALLLATSDVARRYPVPSVQRIVVAAAPLKVLPYLRWTLSLYDRNLDLTMFIILMVPGSPTA